MPDVKQCMSMIKHAWSEVSQETIVNCWKKCKIIKNNYLDTEIQNLMNIDYSCIVSKLDYKLKILNLNKFKYQPINAETLISHAFVDSIETSEELSLTEIVSLVTNKSDNSIEDTDSIEDAECAEKYVNLTEANQAFNDLFKYFES